MLGTETLYFCHILFADRQSPVQIKGWEIDYCFTLEDTESCRKIAMIDNGEELGLFFVINLW